MAAGLSSPGLNWVPKYDIYGQQNRRAPYEDKSHFFGADVGLSKWLESPPPMRSRSEMLLARRRADRPDASYDFDGDGVVSQQDYFVGRTFDKDCDGRLTASERGRGEKAIEDGMLRRRARVHEPVTFGPPASPKLVSFDTSRYSTKSALEMSRRSEARDAGAAILDRYASSRAFVPEPQPSNAQNSPGKVSPSAMRAKADAEHSRARVQAGLSPALAATNPERDQLSGPGLGYREAPAFGSQSALFASRREGMTADRDTMAQGRLAGAPAFGPRSSQVVAKDLIAPDSPSRGLGEQPETRTKMLNTRQMERVEYDMQHFSLQPPQCAQYPKYSERPGNVPFWLDEAQHGARAVSSSPVKRTRSEPTFKITDSRSAPSSPSALAEVSPSRYIQDAQQGDSGMPEPGKGPRQLGKVGGYAKKRFSDENRKQPRLFGNVRPVPPGPNDWRDLDEISSFESVRDAAIQRRKAVHATIEPRVSEMWREPGRPRTPPPPLQETSQDGPASDRPSFTKKSLPAREPRFFGTLSKSMSSPTLSDSSGIRCSGFLCGRPTPDSGQRAVKPGAMAI